ncbi:MAG: glucosamine-6-phosphate deaminase [Spirochaetes bacterium]|uniref:Glucosamine-6-phosphate deaminase n=1 Tax=Candidatus Ornithospirochaeta stercoravium TaxID=2840897 RepID=A0A9D9NDX8_9SPIO|nr:glucosamine-6-phosphate deaminase [Candidatus Ornithospirochaeta stercoravium]
MHIDISDNADELGMRAAGKIASLIEEAINKKGKARIILSTGMSQFETLSHLITYDLPWDKVEMFHLDEYVGLDESHPASFRKYLKERFVSKVNLKAAYFVEGVDAIPSLTRELRKEEIDVGVIGIGENGHIAFNDPPADFTTGEAYKVVTLDRRCREQQVGEGWFRTIDEVPTEAITMCVKEIMKSKHIVSAVPHEVKAEAIYNTITGRISQDVPATILKTHPDWNLFIDKDSASKLLAI